MNGTLITILLSTLRGNRLYNPISGTPLFSVPVVVGTLEAFRSQSFRIDMGGFAADWTCVKLLIVILCF